MAADYARMGRELTRFYDFRNKAVLYAGAGGRQLLPADAAGRWIAVDKDEAALAPLRGQARVEVVPGAFEEVRCRADVVYFEFCLHEMDDPLACLRHALELAPDRVIFDHAPESEWAFFAVEEAKAARAQAAMERLGVRKRATLEWEQSFPDFDALRNRVAPQGPLALERAERHRGAKDIRIPMICTLTLV